MIYFREILSEAFENKVALSERPDAVLELGADAE